MIIEKKYEELKAGDRIWREGRLMEIVADAQINGNVCAFTGRILSNGVRGALCAFRGLAYCPVWVQIGEMEKHESARA